MNPPRYKQGACIQCRKDYGKETYQKDRQRRIQQAIARSKENPDTRRDEQRAYRLGVPVAVVRKVIERCGGKCEACKQPLTNRQMRVDHDHKTGEVRGVLCVFCNALEGMLNKQKDRVQQVLAYVQMAEERAHG